MPAQCAAHDALLDQLGDAALEAAVVAKALRQSANKAKLVVEPPQRQRTRVGSRDAGAVDASLHLTPTQPTPTQPLKSERLLGTLYTHQAVSPGAQTFSC